MKANCGCGYSVLIRINSTRNAATETVQQELLFVGQESGKLLAMRDVIAKVFTLSCWLSVTLVKSSCGLDYRGLLLPCWCLYKVLSVPKNCSTNSFTMG